MNNTVFKCAELSDIDSLTNLRISYFRNDAYENFTDDEANLLSTEVKAYFEKHLNNDCYCFICYEEDIPKSSVIMLVYEKPANRGCPNGKFAEIIGVYTENSSRKKGYASTLMQMAIEKGKELNLSYIDLGASEMGSGLYRKLGFINYDNPYTEMQYKLK